MPCHSCNCMREDEGKNKQELKKTKILTELSRHYMMQGKNKQELRDAIAKRYYSQRVFVLDNDEKTRALVEHLDRYNKALVELKDGDNLLTMLCSFRKLLKAINEQYGGKPIIVMLQVTEQYVTFFFKRSKEENTIVQLELMPIENIVTIHT